MIKSLFTIKDVKAQVYMDPFTQVNEQTAQRTILDSISDPNHPFAKHPEDYSLYYLGTYNDQNGQFNTQEPHLINRLEDIRDGKESPNLSIQQVEDLQK